MVLASILGLGISLVPCLMFGLIIMISFLLCNCEYIGEAVAKHFCAWKNRRKARLKSNNGGKGILSESSKHTKQPSPSCSTSSRLVTSRNRFNLSIINYENNIGDTASAPILWDDGCDNDCSSSSGESTGVVKNASQNSNGESDPPPSYDECIHHNNQSQSHTETEVTEEQKEIQHSV